MNIFKKCVDNTFSVCYYYAIPNEEVKVMVQAIKKEDKTNVIIEGKEEEIIQEFTAIVETLKASMPIPILLTTFMYAVDSKKRGGKTSGNQEN